MPKERKSPQQQIYDAVFLSSINLGYSTFDYLPADDEKYPFVYVGEQFDQDLQTKTSVYGRVQQSVHIYHSHRQRRTLTTMMNNLKSEFRKLKHTENFYVSVKSVTSQIIPEEKLLHGFIEVEFQFH